MQLLTSYKHKGKDMSHWKGAIQRSNSEGYRKEDNGNIEHNIPAELYKIEPGQFVLFVSKEGFAQAATQKMNDLFVYLRSLDITDVKMNVVITDNEEYLIDRVACRSPKDVEDPYKIAIGSWSAIAGLISHYTGLSIEDVVAKDANNSLSLSATERPDVVSLDSSDCPVDEAPVVYYSSDEEIYLGLLTAKPEKGSKEEKKFIAQREKKIEKVLRECAAFDIELNLDEIKKKVKKAQSIVRDYKLIIKTHYNTKYTNIANKKYKLDLCEIYVADSDDCKLNLTSLQTAVYLSFLLYKDGVSLIASYDELRKVARVIYGYLPNSEKTRKADTFLDDTSTIYSYLDTLRTYTSNIRDAVAEKVFDPLLAQKFSIEGLKDAPVKIEMSTPEIRKQIKETFGL